MDQQSQQFRTDRRLHRRRLAFLILLGFVLAAWGPRAATVVTDGWCSSHRALEQERELRATEQRIEALQRQVAYARTSEGRDVEAKRRFGYGPDDEVWITLEANPAPQQDSEAKSVADRINGWLRDAGSRFGDRVRRVGAVFGYWVGVEKVDTCVAVPEVDDEPLTEIDGGEAAKSPTPSAGGDSEAVGDDEDT